MQAGSIKLIAMHFRVFSKSSAARQSSWDWPQHLWRNFGGLKTLNAGQKRSVLRGIIWCSFICIVLAVGLIGLTIWTLRSDAIKGASNDAGNIATILAEQTARSAQSIDIVLSDLVDRFRTQNFSLEKSREQWASHETFLLIKDRASQLSQADVIVLADARGKVLNLTRKWPTPDVDVSDREYFTYFRDTSNKGMYIGTPVISRVSGKSIIFFSKSIRAEDNTLLGIVFIGLAPTYFQNVYNSITTLPDQSFELIRTDNAVLIQQPAEEGLVSSRQFQAANLKIDNRIGSRRKVGSYPLLVNISISEAAALANWKRRSLMIGFGTLIVITCPILLLVFLRRQLSSLLASEESLEEKSKELAIVNSRLDLAFNNMSQGLCFFDGQRRLIVWNDLFAELYGLSPEVFRRGMNLDEIVRLRFEAGSSPKMSSEDYLTWRSSVSLLNVPSDTIVEMNNGKFIKIAHRPMPDGGWVATHEDVTASKRNEARIAYLAHHDALTGLASRLNFMECLGTAREGLATGLQFGILMLDLDRFKAVNDTLGHAAGDKLLVEVAKRLKNITQSPDVVARLGGDEFVILHHFEVRNDGIDPQSMLTLARETLDVINDVFLLEGNTAFVGASIGIALAPQDGREADDLLMKADLALYESKSKGRNIYSFFDQKMVLETEELNRLQDDMRIGLERGEFEVHYQPIIQMSSKAISGAEALVRWRHPRLGLIAPAKFIALAESTGLIIPLGELVMRQACQDASNWPRYLKVAVNLSAIQFQKADLFDVISTALADAGLPPERLEIEVTESVLLENASEYVELLHRLKSIGISIALDDFGTGYSSLTYLKQFPFSKIKIDRTFIDDIAEDEGSMAIVSAIIGLSRSLDMITTAEGIETELQFKIMRAAGVSLGQGYLFGRPVPIAEFNATLEQAGQFKVGFNTV